jgi:hypothetical protein
MKWHGVGVQVFVTVPFVFTEVTLGENVTAAFAVVSTKLT